MNPFESGVRKVIPSVLVYLRKGDQILMIHRGDGRLSDVSQADVHQGKWNGLGGKCELDESPLEAAHREVREESGLDLQLEQFKPLGVLQFPNFKAHKNEDWIVFVFGGNVLDSQLSMLITKTAEGTLHWVDQQSLLSLNLWEGDRHFIPWVLQEKPFMGTLWYKEKSLDCYWLMPFNSLEPLAQF